MTLRDAVKTASNSIGLPAKEAGLTSSNPRLDTTERLGAFRRIIELEVGGTWLRRSRAVERDFGINNLYFKFEGGNPTGTQKDRIAFAQVEDALEKGFGDVGLATCGNYGVAVALAAKLAGVHRGLGTETMMIAASSTAKNPIISSFRKGLKNCVDLDPAKIKETIVNEPLINWHSFDGEEALQSLYQSGGLAYNISDEKMRKMAAYLAEKESLRVLPASTAGLIALLRMHEEGILPQGTHVAVLTAKR